MTTKGGDTGKSALNSGEFISKASEIFGVIGDIDELNSLIGALKSQTKDTEISGTLHSVQSALYIIMAVIATDMEYEDYIEPTDGNVNVIELEHAMQKLMSRIEIEQRFIIPESWYDYARTVARRAERSLIVYIQNARKPVRVEYHDLYHCQKYLNRLSDYLFVVGRYTEEKNKLDTSNR